MKRLSEAKFQRLAAKAREGGAQSLGPNAQVWNIAGNCDEPARMSFGTSRSIQTGVVDLIVRCRACATCLKNRQRHWRGRAAREYPNAPKAWFLTLTFGPVARYDIRQSIKGVELPDERRQRLVKTSGEYLTKYWKRLRKAGWKLKYFAAPEFHKDGTPHWHAIVYTEATKAALQIQWQSVGFSNCQLIRPDNLGERVRYVAKYITKGKIGRVRASFRLGLPSQADAPLGHTDRLREGENEEV